MFSFVKSRYARSFFSLIGAALLLTLGTSCVSNQPVTYYDPSDPANSYLVVDVYSRKVLFRKASEVRRPVASLTKVATGALVTDWAERLGLEGGRVMLTVPQSAAGIGGASPLGLRPGDQLSLNHCLAAAIMGSDNIAALTLADHVGRDLLAREGKGGDPVAHFVGQMNALAKTRGMVDTLFTNPHGLDNPTTPAYSTAEDMARLTIAATKIASFNIHASLPERQVAVVRDGETLEFRLKNTNKLLKVDGIDGVKTGGTSLAGPCVIVSSKRPNEVIEMPDGTKRITPHRLITVLLGSADRFGKARMLNQQGWAVYDQWVASGRPPTPPEEVLTTP